MKLEIKGIIVDWGRTLHDPDADSLFPEAEFVVKALSKKYKLGIVSKPGKSSARERVQAIQHSKIGHCFQAIFADTKSKERVFPPDLEKLNLHPQEVAVVGDRMFREIQWGNHAGCLTIWLQKGKFANELPTKETGLPRHTIHELKELLDLL